MNRVVVLLALCATGCIKMAPIVVTDRVTALEEQAGGSFDELELRLTRAGISPRPLPLTPEQLTALGMDRPEKLRDPDLTPMDLLDRLLRQRCVGEGREGLLVETPQACRGAVDHDEVARAVERANRARAVLWDWLQKERPGATLEETRRAWTEAHRRSVVCDGWVQRPDGTWEARKC